MSRIPHFFASLDTSSTSQAVDVVGSRIGASMTYTGSGVATTSGVAVIMGLSLAEWGIITGIITALAGLGIQFWFKWREDQRQERYLNERLKGERP